jgi:hypothetical protein
MAFIVQSSSERGRVSQYTHATRERIGDAHSAAFRLLALWSSKVFVDRFREQSEPPFVVLPPDVAFRVPLGMIPNFEFVLHLRDQKICAEQRCVVYPGP